MTMEAAALHCSSCGAAIGENDVQCPYCGSQLATVACPRCYGMVSVHASHCPRCGATIASAPADQPSNYACPQCRIPLFTSAVGDAELHQCHRCGGLWLTKERFEHIAADREERGEVLGALPGATPQKAIAPETIRYRPCPTCGQLMNRVNYARVSRVILDVCKDHGLWFDRDELRQVLEFIESGGLEKSRERQIETLQEETRRLQSAAKDAQGPPLVMEGSSVHGIGLGGPGLGDSLMDALGQIFKVW